MRNLYIGAWGIFFIGIALKFLHITGANISMVLSCILLGIHSIIYLCKHRKKDDISKVLLYFSYTILTIYVVGGLLFWGWIKPLFSIGLLLVIATFTLYLIRKEPFKTPQIVLIVYFVFFFILSYTPSYKIYYIFNLNTVINKEQRNTDPRPWDMYSWFLNLRGLKEEALEANQKAKKIVELEGDEKGLEILKQHEALIKTENLERSELEFKWFKTGFDYY